MDWKPIEIPAVAHHQRATNFQRSSVLFSRSMAKAIFFLEDNLDDYIKSTAIPHIHLQRRITNGLHCRKKRFIKSLRRSTFHSSGFFGKARIDQQCGFAGQTLLFSHTRTNEYFAKQA